MLYTSDWFFWKKRNNELMPIKSRFINNFIVDPPNFIMIKSLSTGKTMQFQFKRKLRYEDVFFYSTFNNHDIISAYLPGKKYGFPEEDYIND